MLKVIEGEALTIDNTYIYQTIEITLFTYELEKLFQDGGKQNHFTRSNITAIHDKSETRTHFTFSDSCQYCLKINKNICTYFVSSGKIHFLFKKIK